MTRFVSWFAPIDSLMTEQACNARGDKLSRPLIDHERSNRFALVDRSEGWCLFGPIELSEDDEDIGASEVEPEAGSEEAEGTVDETETEPVDEGDTLLMTLDEIEPGGLYRAGKIMGIVLQLGAASLAIRLIGDPLLDRFVRRRR